MPYLDLERLKTIAPPEFRNRKPYPWVNPAGVITEAGYQQLVQTLPDVSLFAKSFGQKRKFGQDPHDRFVLEYKPGIRLSQPWRDFLHELRQPPYRTFLQEMFGVDEVAMRFHWLYTPTGCSVSPHCDGANELGTHLFYFNTTQDWDQSWGGSTLILDDEQRLPPGTAPSLDAFASEIPSEFMGNYSLLFERTDHSWHAVRELRSPPGRLRKIFSIIVSRNERTDRLTRVLQRPRYQYF